MTSTNSASTKPAIVVVDDDDATCTTIVGALERRYGMDYDVVEARSAEAGRAELDRLHHAGAEVAIIAANAHLNDDFTTFFAGTRDAFPARLLHGEDLNRFIGGARAVTDGSEFDSPEPPRALFS